MSSLIVFTDLDGTLLDHSNYSYEAALPALKKLKELNIPLILASSKTAAEIISLRFELGFDEHPAIVENGAGILPASTSKQKNITDTATYASLTKIINDAPADLRRFYEGFNDWSVDDIMSITGLPRESAQKASERQFSEPGLWEGSVEKKQEFADYLAKFGVSFRHGGRFMTLSFGSTKGQCISKIIDQYSSPSNRPISLALGDAPNDIEMLQATNFGVIISNDHGTSLPTLPEEGTTISRTVKSGPAGWNDAVLEFIEKNAPNIPNTKNSESEK